MPSVNLELVRAMCPAGARGDYSSADWARPEIEGLMPDAPRPCLDQHGRDQRRLDDGDGYARGDARGEPDDGAVGEADAAVRFCGSQLSAEVVESVDGDLAGTAVELLKHVRPVAGCQGERTARLIGGQPHVFLDEVLAGGRRGGGLADDRWVVAQLPTVAVNEDSTRAQVNDDVPFGG